MGPPSSPPMMPVPGWYPDPEVANTWRYWDGARWTEHRAPFVGAPAGRDPHSFSAWFEDSVEAVKRVVVGAGLVIGVVWLGVAALGWLFGLAVLESTEGREARDLLSEASGDALTDAEADRLGELAGDLFVTWVPWLVLLLVLVLLVGLWTVAVCARAAAGLDDGAPSLVAGSLRRTPAVLGAWLVLVVGITVVVALGFVPLVASIGGDLGAVAVSVAAAFGVIAMLVLSVWLGTRLALALPAAALGGHGLGLARSWDLTEHRFWGVLGRLLVAGLLASAITSPLGFVFSFGLPFGFAAFTAMVFVLQAASFAITTVITIAAQTVLIRHLAEQSGDGTVVDGTFVDSTFV